MCYYEYNRIDFFNNASPAHGSILLRGISKIFALNITIDMHGGNIK